MTGFGIRHRKYYHNGRHQTVSHKTGTEPRFVSDSIEGHYRHAAVASDAGPPCARIGTHIMRSRHGSAVDAAIATLLCQCVSNFHSCGIGGGFFMTVYNKEYRSAYTIMARETAPGGANETMFVNRSSTLGGLAVGVPGEIRGYWLAHQIGGRLPWKDLFQPSIKLCREGIVVGFPVAFAMSRQTETIEKFQGLKDLIINPATGRFYEAGETVKRPKLARTLEIIANEGVDAFYNGRLTEDIVVDIQDAGGIITEDDLAEYTALVKDPLVVKLNTDKTVFSPPPPSSGAILQFILNILDGYNLNEKSLSCKQKEIVIWHRIIEAFKFGFAKRTNIGDGDVEDEAFNEELNEFVKTLTSEEYAEEIRAQISDSQTFGTEYYGPNFFDRLNSSGTSHLSVLAPNGDAVSVTSTINLFFGSKVVGSRTGVIFNNEMDDFSTPNTVNAFGLRASPANFIKPGKRPLSSMSPSIVVGPDGVVDLIVGASGGTKIITSTAMVTILTQWLGFSIKEAIDHRRVHHQLLPPNIAVEKGFPQFILDGLVSRGHNITVQDSAGSVVQGILQRREGCVTANSDFRKEGVPDGF
ncbi:gamma-glutamyltranspeptidase / glutathione hydrolase / leukotriene-C4 hydrolase [Mytilus galloprovincialis]|uniref:Gamma-glutamyltranspeptidase / glutathione hydrolase / leukotriene-C4 hydrolase n=1 Tax=Mytilus galloprovincialis TaxID=29158 RepID=A0A8B6C872_MYTGA|nr:gamma-glutamyltranspeptidase / glutathione hydrolase / leukotriene-C4 hydrolase [Mytilus galloprovincialis]